MKNNEEFNPIGKLAYKNHNGMFGKLIGRVEKAPDYAPTKYVLVNSSMRVGANLENLVFVDEEEVNGSERD